jgi:hypothetical protein
MRLLTSFIVVLLVLVGAIVFWLWMSFPTVSYRYRLTVAVDVDGESRAGSSVIEVSYRFTPQLLWGISGQYNLTSVKGQAAVIDLGQRGVLIAALGNNNDPDIVSANALAGRAFQPFARQSGGWYGATLSRVRALSQMQGTAILQSDNLPPFVWFPNRDDPTTAHFVRPANFASVIGGAIRLASAQVEITNDPVVIDIDKKLPLYESLMRLSNGFVKSSNGSILNWSMLIAPGSRQ